MGTRKTMYLCHAICYVYMHVLYPGDVHLGDRAYRYIINVVCGHASVRSARVRAFGIKKMSY